MTQTDWTDITLWNQIPDRMTENTAWHGHIPFAFAIMEMIRPGVFVELGTHRGDSYCAFCQAVKSLSIACDCHAVDTWKGDTQAGYYGQEVFEDLSGYNEKTYGNFSSLHRMPFDEGLSLFSENSIDLLHIDGCHTYETVKHDFFSWLPKMSEKGVVLFHDTMVRERDFGVWKLWEELSHTYPGFNFRHSHGLGVLGVGTDCPPPVLALVNADEKSRSRIRTYFQILGDRLFFQHQTRLLEKKMGTIQSQLVEKEYQIQKLAAENHHRITTQSELEKEIFRLSSLTTEQERLITVLEKKIRNLSSPQKKYWFSSFFQRNRKT